MKTVFDNDQCAHVWASQSQESGRGSKGSVYFEGGALYSYGSHFLTGFILGETVFLNADSYSVSTSRHQSAARWASRHLKQVFLPDLTQLRYALADAKRGRAKESASVIRAYIEGHSSVDFADANALARPFGFSVKQVESMRRQAERNAKKAQAESDARDLREAIRDAQWLADMTEERFQKWRADMSCADDGREVTFHSVKWRADSGKRAALRLFKARKLGKARRFSQRRLATLLGREKAVRAWMARLDEMAAKTQADQVAAHLERFRVEYGAATTDHERYLVVTRNSVDFWRPFASEADQALIDQGKAIVATEMERERERQRKKEKDAFAAWLNSESGSRCPYSFRGDADGSAYIRRSPNGDALETSQGASVPWEHAVKAFRFIKLCRERGEAFHTNGRTIRVGHFTVQSISATGDMVAGCHSFKWAEIERLAEREGVAGFEPSAEAVETR